MDTIRIEEYQLQMLVMMTSPFISFCSRIYSKNNWARDIAGSTLHFLCGQWISSSFYTREVIIIQKSNIIIIVSKTLSQTLLTFCHTYEVLYEVNKTWTHSFCEKPCSSSVITYVAQPKRVYNISKNLELIYQSNCSIIDSDDQIPDDHFIPS